MFKKLILSFLSFLILFVSSASLFVPNANAQWYAQSYDEWKTKVSDRTNPDEIFGERYTAAQVSWVIYGLVYFLQNNIGNKNVDDCLNENSADISACQTVIDSVINSLQSGPTGYAPEGFVAGTLDGISKRPISSVAYFKDIGRKLKLVPEAKAQQGFGFGAANPVLELWKTVRDIAYSLLVIVIVIMAFMIMFRVRISPQVVISVQSALPKVIIALILITFSYAIAGFMIDLMYVVIGLIAGILTNSGLFRTPFDQWSTMFGKLTSDSGIFRLAGSYFLAFSIASISAFTVSWGGSIPVIGHVVGAIFGVIVWLVASIILLVVWIKAYFLLVKTYVMILLSIIVGPFQILFGVFRGGGFGAWIKTMASHLAVYPMTGLMFVLANLFLRNAITSTKVLFDTLLPFNPTRTVGNNAWTPPLSSSGDNPVLWLFASLAIISLIPKTAEIIKSAITGGAFGYGSAIGEGIGPARGVAASSVESFGLGKSAIATGRAQAYWKSFAQSAGSFIRGK